MLSFEQIFLNFFITNWVQFTKNFNGVDMAVNIAQKFADVSVNIYPDNFGWFWSQIPIEMKHFEKPVESFSFMD